MGEAVDKTAKREREDHGLCPWESITLSKNLHKETRKVLVTGGAGFIGANLVRRLISQNFQVHTLIRPDTNTSKIADILSGLKKHEVDLRETVKLKKKWDCRLKLKKNWV